MSSAKNNIEKILKDFEPNLNYEEIWVDSGIGNGTRTLQRFSCEIPQNLKIKTPFIVYLLFREIYTYPILPRFEKVAWEIPILYKNHDFVLAHRKFGFGVSTSKQSKDYEEKAIEVLQQIKYAIPYVEELINPIVKEQVKKGKITLESKYTEVYNRYLFFREKLSVKNKKEGDDIRSKIKNFSWDNFNSNEEAVKGYKEIQRLRQTNHYYLYAMIDSYFSLLEHVSVLLLPFMSHIEIEDVDISQYIGSNWKPKLQLILNHKKNKEANKKIEILNEIKENIRNPVSHGNFLKKGKSFFVHMNGLGAIPFTLTKSKIKYKFSSSNKDFMPISDVIKHFDDFDNYLDTWKTKNGMKYIKRDLPVPFDKKSATEFRRRLRTEKSTEKYIEETIWDLTNVINMDW